jgi:hypothetical protein
VKPAQTAWIGGTFLCIPVLYINWKLRKKTGGKLEWTERGREWWAQGLRGREGQAQVREVVEFVERQYVLDILTFKAEETARPSGLYGGLWQSLCRIHFAFFMSPEVCSISPQFATLEVTVKLVKSPTAF